MAFDFATLPKIKTHGYMGGLGAPAGCSVWDPTTWSTCSTWIINARTELAIAHNAIIDLSQAWWQGIQDIYAWPDSSEKSSALSRANQAYDQSRELLAQDAQMQAEFEQKVAPFANIGLAGLRGLRGLGVIPAIPWGYIALGTFGTAALAAWQISNNLQIKASYEAQAAHYNNEREYNRQCGELLKQGKSCSGLQEPGEGPGAGIPSNLIMIGGALLVALAFFQAMRK